ncbi:MAG TPA: TIGR00266 family protein [Bacilli bacterium]|nr:MAG: hypothetical protein BWY97_00879 [Tenericutes bacterium ADurb.BinA124]HNZ50861.1 TIGR00266 family protein [Bacilli bacterium]HPX84309.1 TIGR00266 family protein [Bacilli bacterium]HQC74320.1 TIGR00266 family protein [Bacilli bacterium]
MKYQIEGGSLPVLIVNLEVGEKLITEGGAMSWMSGNMKMDTSSGGGVKKVFGRMFSGESLFHNIYEPIGKEGMIALASKFPGAIKALEITPDKPVIIQKRAFLACEPRVELSVHWQKKIGVGLFGGEGFIMQKLSGNGLAFIEIDGYEKQYELQENEEMIISTGYLVAMSASCSFNVRSVGTVKNALFGGEGIFNAVVRGPGMVIVQSMPIGNLMHGLSLKK